MQSGMPELPKDKRRRYLGLGLPLASVVILADELDTALYFDAALAHGCNAKSAANWVVGDIMAYTKVALSRKRGCCQAHVSL